ncbi:MAG: glutamate-5-semialdehyde dehydrogenase [Opitutaceae bacterium]|nr:glutamate-5-semialdehyde dehydrogenase [Opitutaceae bacterium]
MLAAIGVVVGMLVFEAIAAMLIGKFHAFGTFTGLYVWAGDTPGRESTILILAKLAGGATITALVLHRAGEPWRHLGAPGFRPAALAVPFLPIVVALTIFVSEIDNLIRLLFGSDGLHGWNIAPGLDRVIGGSWQGMLLAVIIGPLMEEIIFRGIILRGFLGRWRPAVAIVASAALFALTHLNPAQLPVAFGLGVVLGWVYFHTRSLGLCFAGHAINNGAAYFVGFFPYEIANFNTVAKSAGSMLHPWWFDLTGVALLAGGIWLLHRLAPPATPWTVPAEPAPPPAVPPEPAFLGSTTSSPAPAAPANALGAEPPLLEPRDQMSAELVQLITSLAQRARAASLGLATAPTAKKDAALEKLAELIDASHFELLAANQRDLLSPEAGALTAAARERMSLDEAGLRKLAQSVREVVALPDPVGEVLEEFTRPNGLRIRKLRVPIGVIGIIFESRPNVTVDCAVLCLKSGNASILRGGKECFHTNMALAALISQALTAAGLPGDAVQLVPTTDRAALNTLLKLDTLIHCVIPRGGESLIRYVAENSTIPVIKHYKGVCFVYVDDAADLAMAESITVNAKVSRPGVCNAAEQLLVHRSVAEQFLPTVGRALTAKNVQLRCDSTSAEILQRAQVPTTPAVAADFSAEFLDTIMAVRVVDSLDAAIRTINRDSSNHSDAIVTANEAAARRFLAEVDSATVYWNASTRFTDGFEFGYGAEIGISTDRLHARGPMGLRELCSYKFVIEGTGQIRG